MPLPQGGADSAIMSLQSQGFALSLLGDLEGSLWAIAGQMTVVHPEPFTAEHWAIKSRV